MKFAENKERYTFLCISSYLVCYNHQSSLYYLISFMGIIAKVLSPKNWTLALDDLLGTLSE